MDRWSILYLSLVVALHFKSCFVVLGMCINDLTDVLQVLALERSMLALTIGTAI